MSVLTNIATATPGNKYRQSELAGFMSELFQYPDPQKKRLQLMYAKSGIESRYSSIPDYTATMEERVFFPKTGNLEPFPSLEQRMMHFNRAAPELCIKAVEKCMNGPIAYSDITHLITVTCTGLSAPGLDVELVQRLKLSENINRTSINFMGCYAAIHALKQAHYICKSDPEAIVLIVCVELCSIHFQKIDDPDNLTANLLFSDGAAAALIMPEKTATQYKLRGFGIKDFYSHIATTGKSDMAWQLSSTGFLMTLSAYIPQLIESGIKKLFDRAIERLHINQKDITHWAIHPGGRKILEVILQELQLTRADLESSYKILKEYGNMSSPTVLFVLKDIWDNHAKQEEKEKTFCVAFGPGLTMESVILENV